MKLAFEKMDGLIPAVIQNYETKDVLMLGFVDENALGCTQRSGEVHFFSRSRKRLWKKGETSGHVSRVIAEKTFSEAEVYGTKEPE